MMTFNPKVCILGAGFSGICAAIQLQKELNIKDYEIYDKNDDFGGTWLTHTYPGCACDIPSHLYSLSFELNPEWSSTYARQPEILEYLKKVATKYDLYSNTKFNHKVKTATWDEGAKKWKIVVHDMKEDKVLELVYDIVIVGSGPFGNANIPEQFNSFKGHLIHSSKWDSKVELDNKVVGIVGSGASAIQIIPQIVPNVKKLLSFQRRPAWVTPQPLYTIPSTLKTAFRVIPGLLLLFRFFIFIVQDLRFFAFKAKSWLADLAENLAKKDMKRDIPDSGLRDKLIPEYRIGCKRITPSNTYFKSLADSKVEVIRSDITSVNEKTITTSDGREYSVDVLILATGYRVQDFWSPLIVIGRNSKDLFETMKAKKYAHYLGIVVSEAPNAFMVLGPNTAYGHNSVIFSIECQVSWVMKVIKEMIRRDSRAVSVKPEAEIQYRTMINDKMKKLVWGAYKCESWYNTEDGTNTTVHPGNATSYWSSTKNVDFDKLDFH